MTTVGSQEVKARLSELLNLVAKGEEILITNRGKPIARLVPPQSMSEEPDVGQVVQAMLEARAMNRFRMGKGWSIRKLVEEGRRF